MTLIRMLKGQSGSLTQKVCHCSQQMKVTREIICWTILIPFPTFSWESVSQVFHLYDNYRSPRPGTHAQSLL